MKLVLVLLLTAVVFMFFPPGAFLVLILGLLLLILGVGNTRQGGDSKHPPEPVNTTRPGLPGQQVAPTGSTAVLVRPTFESNLADTRPSDLVLDAPSSQVAALVASLVRGQSYQVAKVTEPAARLTGIHISHPLGPGRDSIIVLRDSGDTTELFVASANAPIREQLVDLLANDAKALSLNARIRCRHCKAVTRADSPCWACARAPLH